MHDTMTFEVFSGNLKRFKAFIKKTYGFSVVSTRKDGGYSHVTIANKCQFENWASVVKFYRESIKI